VDGHDGAFSCVIPELFIIILQDPFAAQGCCPRDESRVFPTSA
jgi:hypothetical protein